MKKVALIICLILIGNCSIAQNYTAEDNVEEIEINVERSAFSVGFSPFVYIGVNDYKPYSDESVGVGLEIMGLYSFNKNFSIGGFFKVKGELNGEGVTVPGGGSTDGEKIINNGAGSLGAIIEYKIFNKIGVNFRVGYEEIFTSQGSRQEQVFNSPNGGISSTIITPINNDPGFIYGGGISLYKKRKEPYKALHSFNLGIVFEKNNYTEIDMLDIGANEFKSSKINAFYIHFGWRIMFHSLKGKM